MTTITILPERSGETDISFRAMGRQREAVGPTVGAALDALTQQLDSEDAGTLVVVQREMPDEFFTASQQKRMSELFAIRNGAARGGRLLSDQEQSELEQLVNAELEGATKRSAAIARESGL